MTLGDDLRLAASRADELDAVVAQLTGDVQTLTDRNAALVAENADLRAQLAASVPAVEFGANAAGFTSFQSALGSTSHPLDCVRVYGGDTSSFGTFSNGLRLLLDTKEDPTSAAIDKVRAYVAQLPKRPVLSYYGEIERRGIAATTFKSKFADWYAGLHDLADLAFCLMGQTFRDPTIYGSAEDWFPGEAVVDLVMTDPYLKASPYKGPEYLFGPCRDFAVGHGLPWSVGEYGLKTKDTSTGKLIGTPEERAAWFASLGDWIFADERNRPRYLSYFEKLDAPNDYRIAGEPVTTAAYAALVDRVRG